MEAAPAATRRTLLAKDLRTTFTVTTEASGKAAEFVAALAAQLQEEDASAFFGQVGDVVGGGVCAAAQVGAGAQFGVVRRCR